MLANQDWALVQCISCLKGLGHAFQAKGNFLIFPTKVLFFIIIQVIKHRTSCLTYLPLHPPSYPQLLSCVFLQQLLWSICYLLAFVETAKEMK